MLTRTKKIPSDRIETVVGAAARFSGELRSEGGIRIDGTCEGTVEALGNVIVGEGGRVLADIHADNVSVAGAVKGNIEARGRLEILATGRVWGDLMVESFLIEEGGFFRGNSAMTNEPEPPLIQSPDEDNVQVIEPPDARLDQGNDS